MASLAPAQPTCFCAMARHGCSKPSSQHPIGQQMTSLASQWQYQETTSWLGRTWMMTGALLLAQYMSSCAPGHHGHRTPSLRRETRPWATNLATPWQFRVILPWLGHTKVLAAMPAQLTYSRTVHAKSLLQPTVQQAAAAPALQQVPRASRHATPATTCATPACTLPTQVALSLCRFPRRLHFVRGLPPAPQSAALKEFYSWVTALRVRATYT
jgi:hypothetical protein